MPYRHNQVFLDALRNTNDPRLDHIGKYYTDKPYAFMERTDITPQVKAVVGITRLQERRFCVGRLEEHVHHPGARHRFLRCGQATRRRCSWPISAIANNAPFPASYLRRNRIAALAEACFRWGLNLNGDYQAHYNRGIEAAMKQLSVYPGGPQIPDTAIAKY